MQRQVKKIKLSNKPSHMNSGILDLSIIIVNYNAKDLLKPCIQSILDQETKFDFEILVVDNDSRDGSVTMLKENFSQIKKIRLLNNNQNLGFSKANNLAIKEAAGRYVLLLNPDTLIISGAIDRLVGFLNLKDDVAAVGAKLLNGDGSIQHSIGHFPTIFNQLARSLFLHRLFPKVDIFCELETHDSSYQNIKNVDWVYGAAIMMRKSVIDETGLFDESFFLFSEETDLCYRINQAGYNILYCPDAHIIHYGRGLNINSDILAQLNRSKLQYFRKHYSAQKYTYLFMITVTNIIIRLSIWLFINLLSVGQNELAKKKLFLYRRALMGLFKKTTDLNFQ